MIVLFRCMVKRFHEAGSLVKRAFQRVRLKSYGVISERVYGWWRDANDASPGAVVCVFFIKPLILPIMNSTDFLILNILGSLLPLAALLLSAVMIYATVKDAYEVRLAAAEAAEARQAALYDEMEAEEGVSAVMDAVRTARGRVSTAMRTTRHPRPVEHYAAA